MKIILLIAASAFHIDMQKYAILVLLFVSETLGYRDVGEIQQQTETSTVNDVDNSVYPGNDASNEPSPVPQQFPEHMPTTGCFGNVPAAQEVEATKSNSIESGNSVQPQLPLSDPIPPQFGSFAPPRQPAPGFGPGSVGPWNYHSRPPFVPFAPPPPPMPFSPYQRFAFPNQPNSPHHAMVIVKLLQPIILPVARPMFPEGGDRNPDDDVDSERYTNSGFPRGHGFHRFNSNRRFGAEKYRSVERSLPYRQNTFGPYKVGGGEENIHVTVKLH